jgi:hypothetical protein
MLLINRSGDIRITKKFQLVQPFKIHTYGWISRHVLYFNPIIAHVRLEKIHTSLNNLKIIWKKT